MSPRPDPKAKSTTTRTNIPRPKRIQTSESEGNNKKPRKTSSNQETTTISKPVFPSVLDTAPTSSNSLVMAIPATTSEANALNNNNGPLKPSKPKVANPPKKPKKPKKNNTAASTTETQTGSPQLPACGSSEQCGGDKEEHGEIQSTKTSTSAQQKSLKDPVVVRELESQDLVNLNLGEFPQFHESFDAGDGDKDTEQAGSSTGSPQAHSGARDRRTAQAGSSSGATQADCRAVAKIPTITVMETDEDDTTLRIRFNETDYIAIQKSVLLESQDKNPFAKYGVPDNVPVTVDVARVLVGILVSTQQLQKDVDIMKTIMATSQSTQAIVQKQGDVVTFPTFKYSSFKAVKEFDNLLKSSPATLEATTQSLMMLKEDTQAKTLKNILERLMEPPLRLSFTAVRKSGNKKIFVTELPNVYAMLIDIMTRILGGPANVSIKSIDKDIGSVLTHSGEGKGGKQKRMKKAEMMKKALELFKKNHPEEFQEMGEEEEQNEDEEDGTNKDKERDQGSESDDEEGDDDEEEDDDA